ncbi:MAG: hypothetical protein QM503_06550 [Bacteroidota bacterium]
MKKLLFITMSVLISANLLAQVSNSNFMRIQSNDIKLGRGLPTGTQITDINQQRAYILNAPANSTDSLENITDKFEITVWRHDAINGVIYPNPINSNVGIGTSIPQATLDVAGHIWQTQLGNSVFLGYEAGLVDDLSENDNVFVGYQAGKANTSGFENVAVGYQAFSSNTTGYKNIAIGNGSLRNTTTGFDNVSIGYESMTANETGTFNVAIGKFALQNNLNGDRNVAIGSCLADNISGNGNIAIGEAALTKTSGNYNVAVGLSALQNQEGISYNVAVGYRCFQYNTGGSNNTGLGYAASQYNSTGANNVSIGQSALNKNTSGINNVVIGSFAANTGSVLRSNVYIGYRSGYNAQSSDNNTCLGYYSGYSLNSGFGNSFLGWSAGQDAIAASYNIVIGYDVQLPDNNGDNQLNIGNAIYSTDLAVGMIGLQNYQEVQIDSIFTEISTEDDNAIVTAGGIKRFVESSMAKLKVLSSSPLTPEDGTIYYSSTDNNIHIYSSGNWYSINMSID